MEEGIGSISDVFEYVVVKKVTAKVKWQRAALLFSYVLWCLLWLLLAVSTVLIVPLLTFLPLSLWIFVHLTWRLTQVSFELSFFAGEMTVSKIYGDKKRKELTVIPLKRLELVAPYNEETRQRIAQVDFVIPATAEDQSDRLYLLYGRDKADKTVLIYLDMNDKVMKIISFYNRSCIRKENV